MKKLRLKTAKSKGQENKKNCAGISNELHLESKAKKQKIK